MRTKMFEQGKPTDLEELESKIKTSFCQATALLTKYTCNESIIKVINTTTYPVRGEMFVSQALCILLCGIKDPSQLQYTKKEASASNDKERLQAY